VLQSGWSATSSVTSGGLERKQEEIVSECGRRRKHTCDHPHTNILLAEAIFQGVARLAASPASRLQAASTSGAPRCSFVGCPVLCCVRLLQGTRAADRSSTSRSRPTSTAPTAAHGGLLVLLSLGVPASAALEI
jgi:hypothetical protein